MNTVTERPAFGELLELGNDLGRVGVLLHLIEIGLSEELEAMPPSMGNELVEVHRRVNGR